jgi:hypothetical protein
MRAPQTLISSSERIAAAYRPVMRKSVSRQDFLIAVGLVTEHAAVIDMLLCSCYVTSAARARQAPSIEEYHAIDSAYQRGRFVIRATADWCPEPELECIRTVADANERAHKQRQVLAHTIATQSQDGTVFKLNMRNAQPMQRATHGLIESVLNAAQHERERASAAVSRLCTLQASRSTGLG